MRQRLGVTAAAVFLFSFASMANAQDQPVAARPASPERFGIGAVGAIGLFGNVAGLRGSGPLGEKLALDVTVGHIDGRGESGSGSHGTSLGAHVRWLWHGRNANGRSGYWLFGPLVFPYTDRTEIRWPNRVTTYLVEKKTVATVLVGYGWDVQMKSGARAGVEITTGGGSEGSPTSFVNAFVVWGPPRRH
jgi:hypothetical protein